MQCSAPVEPTETKKVVQSWQTAIHARQDSIVTKRVLKNQAVKNIFCFIGIFTEDHCATTRTSFICIVLNYLLPPYVVRQKIMFSIVCGSVHRRRRGSLSHDAIGAGGVRPTGRLSCSYK